MPVKQQGFSLTEVLIAMAIGSVLLLSAARFLPALQQSIALLTKQQELKEELWLRIAGIGKHLQRAGYCAGKCAGEALKIGQGGECVIVQWDENSNGRWETSPPAAAEQTGFRLNDGALETLRGATLCGGKGWERITDPDRIRVLRFHVQRVSRAGFAPELSLALTASVNGLRDGGVEAHHIVTGFNL
ncbi:prepilin peptidase-dependent protein [Leclercia adecarboxylata]|uniref:prepilin peptidase-dependent protein n=1 Tax=Leclercia adecarboxylata TaxID=83655 RepID=UPI002DBB4931|nr:prepilin peptidase-dependent protein [Leclercia adecarboxylata]MEB6380258.1 prepilin peptidase-dependent protein [Leclercia adecarboxylata]